MAVTGAIAAPDAGHAPATDSRGRPARAALAHLLLAIACLPILGMLVIAPVLPDMQRAFASVHGVAYLVPLVLTAPALMIVLVSPWSGRLAARIGRRNALVAALIFYFVTATAPLWLSSLSAIIISRLGVGVAEAVLMTVSTMLIGDYFEPRRRDRYLAYQVIYTSVSAVLFLIVGGLLGEAGWRVPFFAYFVALLLLLPTLLFVWEPAQVARPDLIANGREPMPWRAILPICAMTFIAGGCMNLVSVDLGYLIEAVGTRASALKGMGAAVNSCGIAIGAGFYSFSAARPRRTQLGMAFLLSAVGFVVLAQASSFAGTLAGGGVTGLASGFYLAWLLAAVNRSLNFQTRGLGVGLWMTAYFLATLLAPLALVAIGAVAGGLKPAMLVFAAAMAALTATVPFLRVEGEM
ncbi:MFS transporter [Sphingomonas mali]|uniref:MFS transporter n=1 Tax=Sphingomonas mali TaxID=40682 RepID=UPI000833B35E|nr:MFS transporter [Sphingomonas mali]